MTYWQSAFQDYFILCGFLGMFGTTTIFLMVVSSILHDGWLWFKKAIRKPLRNIAIRVYRACK